MPTFACCLPWATGHGLISGATGTDKTVTLQTIARAFSASGVPVFVADVRWDALSWLLLALTLLVGVRKAVGALRLSRR